MTTDAFLILRTVLLSCWQFFISWRLPGTHATPASLAMFLLTAVITLKFFLRVAQVNAFDAHNDK